MTNEQEIQKRKEQLAEIDQMKADFELSEDDFNYCFSVAMTKCDNAQHQHYSLQFEFEVYRRLSSRIRYLAKRNEIVAKSRKGKWFFSDLRNVLVSPESGLDIVEAAKWFHEAKVPR